MNWIFCQWKTGGTTANASDISQTPAVLHGQKSEVWADAGYVGVHKRENMQAALAAHDQTVRGTRRYSVAKAP